MYIIKYLICSQAIFRKFVFKIELKKNADVNHSKATEWDIQIKNK
jgi:hypothetical protein